MSITLVSQLLRVIMFVSVGAYAFSKGDRHLSLLMLLFLITLFAYVFQSMLVYTGLASLSSTYCCYLALRRIRKSPREDY